MVICCTNFIQSLASIGLKFTFYSVTHDTDLVSYCFSTLRESKDNLLADEILEVTCFLRPVVIALVSLLALTSKKKTSEVPDLVLEKEFL